MERSNIGNYCMHVLWLHAFIVIDVKLPTKMQLLELDDIEFPGSTGLSSTNLNNKAEIKIPTSIISAQFDMEGTVCLYVCVVHLPATDRF